MSDLISRQAAIDDIWTVSPLAHLDREWIDRWLRQLPPAQPEQPEIIQCKDCKKHNKDYHMSPYKDTVCPLTAWRGTAQGHEFDYQFCVYAERKTE